MATNKPLQSIVLQSTTASVVFSNIDQSYTDLRIVAQFATGSAGNSGYMYFNEDTSSQSNYNLTSMYGNGSAMTVGSRAGNSGSFFWFYGHTADFGNVSTIDIANYTNTTTYKTSLSKNNNPGATEIVVSSWNSTAAINKITLSAPVSSFVAGSTFDLYGIKSGAPKAFGGDLVTTDGNYWYHTFRSSGTFLLEQPTSVDYLVVAGGGGGGDAAGGHGGGGGAGGLRSTVTATGGGGSLESALSMTPGSYTVTVGAGGAGVLSHGAPYGNGTSGSNSVFATITSTGGGYGGGYNTSTGLSYVGGSGGSGGGGSDNPGGAASPSGQGYAGSTGSTYIGGGGGGAGEAGGTDGTGQGGDGIATSISGSSVTYAGGGGGSSASSPNQGGTKVGGDGGGGNGQVRDGAAGSAGTANLGGGGGGSSTTASYSGGSGIVIVRYAV